MDTYKKLPAVARDTLATGPQPSAPYPLAIYGGEGVDRAYVDSGIVNYYRLLYRHKFAIILSSLAGLAMGFVAGIPLTPKYRAQTSLEVLNLNEEFMNMKRNSPLSASDPTYDVSESETQTKLLQSSAVLDKVIEKLDTTPKRASVAPKIASTGWRGWMHLPEPAETSGRQELLAQAASSLKVRTTPHTRVIELSVESTSADLAAEFANALAATFIKHNLEARFASMNPSKDWLTREISEARANLKRAEDDLQAYARQSGLIFSDDHSNLATEKLQQLQQQLAAASAERIARQARLELGTKSPPDALPDVLADTRLKETSQKIDDLRRQVAELSTIYNPEFAKIKQADAQLAVLQGVYERTRADVLKRIENDYDEARSREKLLASAYDTQVREVTGQDEKAIQYNILKREVDSNRKLYDAMLQQTKESSITSALQASPVRVIDPASVPSAPFFPNFRVNSALGFLGGLVFSIALITIRERADRTLQQPGDLRLWTDLKELGTIPASRFGMGRIFAGPSLAISAPRNAAAGELAPASKNLLPAVNLELWREKSGFIAEAFRSVLSSILFTESDLQVLVFTSPHPYDGKTTIVGNLAITGAEIKRKVLIIDADLRRPRIHEFFDVPSERGLGDLLGDNIPLEQASHLIVETGIPNLSVLPAGQPVNGAAHLLHSRNLPALLERVRRDYDIVLVDTPPMLEMTDARVVGRLADAIILVARSGKTTRDSILAAKDRLDGDSIRVLGTILNHWDPKKTPGGYYGGFGRQYYSNYKYYADKS